MADEPSRFLFAAVLAARGDQPVERQELSSRFGRAGRHVGQRIYRGDAAGRRRLHVHHRRLGRGLQDRRALGPGPHRLENGPGQEKPDRNRGVALWGNLVISVTGLDGRVIATERKPARSSGKEAARPGGLEITAAPLALKDSIIGASGGDNGTRNWIASLDAKTGKMQWKTFGPAPASPAARPGRTRSTPGRPAAARCTSPAPTIRDQLDLLGLGQSVAALRFRLSARRQPLHQQLDRLRRRDRKDGVVLPAHRQRQPRL